MDQEEGLLEFFEVVETIEDDGFRGFLDLASEEDLVQDGVDAMELEDEVELTHVPEESVFNNVPVPPSRIIISHTKI
jgi:hypothetical protein